MKRIFRLTSILALSLTLTVPVVTSCSDENEFDTNQYTGGVHLNSYGPSPVARGGQLRFLGSGMDKITKITLPGSGDITDIEIINSGEIRITVPQNAEPGIVRLHHAGGTIDTKTELTYSEPISIEEIAPLRVKPGETLSIKGEYLNLIKEVCFSFAEGKDSVNVFSDKFIAHDRNNISLSVPAEAVSGPIFISDAKAMPNMIESEMAIEVVLPAPTEVKTLPSAKPGDRIRVEGNDFDLVTSVLTPADEEIEYVFTPGASGAKDAIEFTLPDNTPDGAVTALTASGIKVALVNIGMAVPADLTVVPADNIRGGDIVTIKGINLDQVTGVQPANCGSAVQPESATNSELTFRMPEEAWSGEATLYLKSGKTVTVALATALPEVTGFNPDPAPAGAVMTIYGRNLDLVESVTFAGVTEAMIPEAKTASELTVKVPALASAGELVLTKGNGESSKSKKLEINAPESAYVVSCDTEEPTAGEIMTFTIGNSDKLTGVEVNNTAVQYIVNGTKLYINLPSSCGAGTTIRLISSNGEISYTYDVIPATHVEKVIFEGMFDLANWDAGGLRLYKEDLQGVPAGAKMIFHLSAAADAQIQVNDANWGQLDIIDVPAGSTKAEYELTADRLNRLMTTEDGWSSTAIVVNGHTAVISKVTLEYEQSKETAIWEGSWESGNWGGNQDLAWGGFDWSTVKAGSTMRLYVTPTVGDPANDWWCVAVRHGDGWEMLPAPVADQYGQPVSGVVDIPLPQNVLDDLIAHNGLVITGADYILTKVTIE